MKTLAANVAVGQAQKKKENPYLSHRSGPVKPVEAAVDGVAPPVVPTTPTVVYDERIKASSRDLRAKRAFNFVEAGKLIMSICNNDIRYIRETSRSSKT